MSRSTYDFRAKVPLKQTQTQSQHGPSLDAQFEAEKGVFTRMETVCEEREFDCLRTTRVLLFQLSGKLRNMPMRPLGSMLHYLVQHQETDLRREMLHSMVAVAQTRIKEIDSPSVSTRRHEGRSKGQNS